MALWLGSGVSEVCIQVPASVDKLSDKLFNIPQPRSLHLYIRNNTYFIGLFGG